MSSRLTPQFAAANPDQFGLEAYEHARSKAVHGARVIDYTLTQGQKRWGRNTELTVDPNGWASRGNVLNGTIQLGVAPMDRANRAKLIFNDATINYADEVALRLIHENNHAFFALAEDERTPGVRGLISAVRGARADSNGQKGFSSVGSLGFYPETAKPMEDAVELMTMYTWNPSYLEQFSAFLTDPAHEPTRNEMGLVTITTQEAPALCSIVEMAVEQTLTVR